MGIHVIPPMRDLPVFKSDDRAEAVFIVGPGREDRSADLILDDDAAAVLPFGNDQIARGEKADTGDISLELLHQFGAPPHHTRPAQIVDRKSTRLNSSH